MGDYKNNFDFLDSDISASENEDTHNPFFLGIGGSEYKYTTTKSLSEMSTDLYIMCLTDGIDFDTATKNRINLFFDPDADIGEIYGQNELVTFIAIPFALINIPSIRCGLIKINNCHLQKFNHELYEIKEGTSFVYLMLTSAETDVKQWSSCYAKQVNLDKFIRQKIFISHHDLADQISGKSLIDSISDVADFSYWENPQNCRLSINQAFQNRMINLRKKWNLPIGEIEQLAKNISDTLTNTAKIADKAEVKKGMKTTVKAAIKARPKFNSKVRIDKEPNSMYENYRSVQKKEPTDTDAPGLPQINYYVDASKSDKPSYFPVSTPIDRIISPETIRELLLGHALTTEEKYHLISNLLISKNYCHYVVGDPDILTTYSDMFEKYKPLFRYLMSYTFITLYKEESIKKTRTVHTDRHIFDIETASKLPVFEFAVENPHTNPYFTLFVSKDMLSTKNNIGSVKQNFDFQAGIVDLAEFKRRLNIFVSGTAEKNYLEGISWKNMVVTGGCMAGIMPKINPLMMLFGTMNPTDKKSPLTLTDAEMNNFFNEYYSRSDIDIMCTHPNFFDFIEDTRSLKKIISKNSNIKEVDIQISPIKTVTIHVDIDILKSKCDDKTIPFAYDYAIKNKNKLEIKHYFYEIYLEQKRKSNSYNKNILGNLINDPLYYIIIDYAHLDDVSLVFRSDVNKIDLGQRSTEFKNNGISTGLKMFHVLTADLIDIADSYSADSDCNNRTDIFIKTVDNIKYKIISKHLKHPFEVFRIDFPEYLSSISKFHFPCVRSFYTGETVYMTVSALTAYMTMTNIEYKYFSGSQDPVSIINKYRERGYSTFFNKNEISQIVAYSLTNDTDKKRYGITSVNDCHKMLGFLDHKNLYFRPRQLALAQTKNLPGISDKIDTKKPPIKGKQPAKKAPIKGKSCVQKEAIMKPTAVSSMYKEQNLTYHLTSNDIANRYKNKYGPDSLMFLALTSVDSDGNVTPVKKWTIRAAYDLLS